VVNTADDASSQPDLVLRLLAEVVRGRDEEAMAMTTMRQRGERRENIWLILTKWEVFLPNSLRTFYRK